MSPRPPRMMTPQSGSAIMVALFVIVIMALLAAAMGRFLLDSSEKNTVEVRGVRALMAAQSGLEIALYQLFPNRSGADVPAACANVAASRAFANDPGLKGCKVAVSCNEVQTQRDGEISITYRLTSQGLCGGEAPMGASPDFAVSRTLVAEAFDGVTP
jgi:MSHA biogenesis protein MshP